MAIRTLVVGGTGPSGVHIVNFLLAAGHRVSVFNSGQHDDGVSFDSEVERIYGDARDAASIHGAFASRKWDIAICTYGRLRVMANELEGKTGR